MIEAMLPGLRHAHGGSSTILSLGLSSSMAFPLGCVKDHLPDREIQVQDQDRVRTSEANQQRCRARGNDLWPIRTCLRLFAGLHWQPEAEIARLHQRPSST